MTKLKLYQSSYFVKLSQHYFLEKVQIQFCNERKPILCLMEQILLLRTSDGNLTEMNLEFSITFGLEYVKENIEYIFSDRK